MRETLRLRSSGKIDGEAQYVIDGRTKRAHPARLPEKSA